jgi:putative Mg2+ transporter-C (MgtC) family protein
MNSILDALALELATEMPDVTQVVRVTVRLVMAMLLAGVIGWERERGDNAAGLRTHILVALGAALMVVSTEEAGADAASVTRVVQGIAAGIGFIGGGVILKLPEEKRIEGLTTAATIWLAAAIGMAAGMGRLVSALLGLLLAWLVLGLLTKLKWHINPKNEIVLNGKNSDAAH